MPSQLLWLSIFQGQLLANLSTISPSLSSSTWMSLGWQAHWSILELRYRVQVMRGRHAQTAWIMEEKSSREVIGCTVFSAKFALRTKCSIWNWLEDALERIILLRLNYSSSPSSFGASHSSQFCLSSAVCTFDLRFHINVQLMVSIKIMIKARKRPEWKKWHSIWKIITQTLPIAFSSLLVLWSSEWSFLWCFVSSFFLFH